MHMQALQRTAAVCQARYSKRLGSLLCQGSQHQLSLQSADQLLIIAPLCVGEAVQQAILRRATGLECGLCMRFGACVDGSLLCYLLTNSVYGLSGPSACTVARELGLGLANRQCNRRYRGLRRTDL